MKRTALIFTSILVSYAVWAIQPQSALKPILCYDASKNPVRLDPIPMREVGDHKPAFRISVPSALTPDNIGSITAETNKWVMLDERLSHLNRRDVFSYNEAEIKIQFSLPKNIFESKEFRNGQTFEAQLKVFENIGAEKIAQGFSNSTLTCSLENVD